MALVILLTLLVAGVVHVFLRHFGDGGLLLGVVGIIGGVFYLMQREASKGLGLPSVAAG